MEKISALFSRNLTALRKAHKLSQVELANLCGWDTQSRISNYENNVRTPDLDDIEVLAKAMNVEVLDLLATANGVREPQPTYIPASQSQKIQETMTKLLTGHLIRHFDAKPISEKISCIIYLYELLQNDTIRDSITTLDKQTLLKLLKIEE